MASEDNIEIVRCNNCMTVVNESPSLQRSQRTPCPVCGSLSRDHIRLVDTKVAVAVPKLKTRGKRLGKGKPFIEQEGKHEVYHDTGEEQDVTRVFDHEHNTYIEIIKDSKTGKVICEHREPLDQHRGHGYAKRRVNEGGNSRKQ